MKKIILNSIGLSAAIIFLFSGCKKSDTSGGSTSNSTTVITGAVFADMNVTVAEDRAPDNTRIVALIDPNDLLANPDTSKKYDAYRYPTTVIGGNYSVTVPALNKGTVVKLVMEEFVANQTQGDGTTVRKIYKPFTTVEITVYAGTTKVVDLYYMDI